MVHGGIKIPYNPYDPENSFAMQYGRSETAYLKSCKEVTKKVTKRHKKVDNKALFCEISIDFYI